MDDILFTCAGLSDPVCGNYDGSILHIMRYYRPKSVYIFLSQEIADLEAKDQRFEKTFQHMKEYCAKQGVVYQPELILYNSHLDDVSKIDLVEKPLLDYFTDVVVKNPNCRILLNLSSGSPQMKTMMQFFAIDSPYHVLGIQVDGPKERQGEKSHCARTMKCMMSMMRWQQTMTISQNLCLKVRGTTEHPSRKCRLSIISAIGSSC